ncbi:MAG: ABC transporter substrate-binding protein, partial [Acidimicrobiia bacterium]
MTSPKKLISILAVSFILGPILVACQMISPGPGPDVIRQTVIVTSAGGTAEIVQVVTPTPEPQGERTLVICDGQEPGSLYWYGTNELAATQIWEAIYDGASTGGYDANSFAYQPVILEKQPSLADGDAVINPVAVAPGDTVVGDAGEPVTLEAGGMVRPAGCRSSDCAIEYDGSSDLEMDQFVVTFSILPGIAWSDGEPVTAGDSVYSFNLNADPDTPAPSRLLVERTAAYEALDDATAQWTGLPGYIDATYFINFWQPLPEHAWGQFTAAELVEAEEASRAPLGFGPYVIDEWTSGDNITLHKNPNYFRADEGLPKFENLVYRFVGENSNANIAAVLAGECDIVDQTSHLDDQSELLLELQGSGQVNATFVTGTVWEHADFNIQPLGASGDYFAAWDTDGDGFGPFGDQRLREAVLACMDRQSVVDTVMFGQSVVLDTYLPPQHPLFNADARHVDFDPAAGAALLDEIGWVDDDGDPATARVASGVTGVPDGTLLEFALETTEA